MTPKRGERPQFPRSFRSPPRVHRLHRCSTSSVAGATTRVASLVTRSQPPQADPRVHARTNKGATARARGGPKARARAVRRGRASRRGPQRGAIREQPMEPAATNPATRTAEGRRAVHVVATATWTVLANPVPFLLAGHSCGPTRLEQPPVNRGVFSF